ncbi:hypothetical protein [Cohaesibacter sp. ES.047]|nr:hypothetical protein [Cohaesibacter sp. ES.047]
MSAPSPTGSMAAYGPARGSVTVLATQSLHIFTIRIAGAFA